MRVRSRDLSSQFERRWLTDADKEKLHALAEPMEDLAPTDGQVSSPQAELEAKVERALPLKVQKKEGAEIASEIPGRRRPSRE